MLSHLYQWGAIATHLSQLSMKILQNFTCESFICWKYFSIHRGKCFINTVIHYVKGHNLFRQRSSSIKDVFHWWSSSIEGCLQSIVVFHQIQRPSSFKRCLPSKVVLHKKLASIKGCVPSKVVFHQRSSSTKGHLQLNVVFHQRSSSIKRHPWLTVVFN